ncbi:hypothetical protein [Lysinibacillus xylanilyticus]|uniref:hypothetical protein n=1 Tax=Lysinibacillus xylanilyticus TaxID=582475 RepID=UPI003D031106
MDLFYKSFSELEDIFKSVATANIEKKTYDLEISKNGVIKSRNIEFPKNPGVYIFYVESEDVFINDWTDYKEIIKTGPNINDISDRLVTENVKPLYLGKEWESVSMRLNQHLSEKTNLESKLSAMYLKGFAKHSNSKIKLHIEVYIFNDDNINSSHRKIVINAFETLLHMKLKPILGKA